MGESMRRLDLREAELKDVPATAIGERRIEAKKSHMRWLDHAP
jgi:hypothetical protein